ncbi:MAG: 4'-phosphopantetheinyl transferase family protein [Pseudobdellovibrionaceae bacterium]
MNLPNNVSLLRLDLNEIHKIQSIFKKQFVKERSALVYVLNSDVILPPSSEYLSAEEVQEFSAISSEEKQTQFLISHWLQKKILSILLEIPVIEITILKGPLGKPYLDIDQNSLNVDFNTSHTKEITLLGIVQDMQIGVDVEKIVERKYMDDLALKFFSLQEVEWMKQSFDHQEKLSRFFRLWTMKEAVIKTLGGGVFQNIHQFSFQEINNKLSLQSSLEPWSLTESWQLFELNDIKNHACSIAVSNHSNVPS